MENFTTRHAHGWEEKKMFSWMKGNAKKKWEQNQDTLSFDENGSKSRLFEEAGSIKALGRRLAMRTLRRSQREKLSLLM